MLAERLFAYPGVMQAHAHVQATERPGVIAEPPQPGAAPAAAQQVPFESAIAHAGFKGDGQQFPPVFSKM